MKTMKLVHNGKDINDIVTSYTWSGDYKQVARVLDFNIVVSPTDPYLSKIELKLGDMVKLYEDNGKELFRGYIFSKDLSLKGTELSITCYDGLIYLTKSTGSYNFMDATPGEITRKVAADFGIETGDVESGGRISRVYDGENLYNIIQTAYTLESHSSHKAYMLRMREGKLTSMLKGAYTAKYELDAKTVITDASYSESMDGSVNRVKIYNEEGVRTGTIDSEGVPGVIQDVYKEEEGVNIEEGARSLLKGIERKANINAIGDLYCIVGNAVLVKESYTGLTGIFFIESDTHTFSGGQHTMQLGIAFENIMDEQMVGKSYAEIAAENASKNQGGSSSKGGLIGSSNEERTWWYLLDQGYSKTAAAGVMGNLKQESQTFDPKQRQIGGGPGRGIAQWTKGRGRKDRWDHLIKWAKGKNSDPYALIVQLQYIMLELGGNTADNHSRNMLIKHGGPSALKKMSVRKSTTVFHDAFERSKDPPPYTTRYNAAKAIYNKYKNAKRPDPPKRVSSSSASGGRRGRVVAAARAMIGFRYSQANRFGSKSADCSSLILRSMAKAGLMSTRKNLTTHTIGNDNRFYRIPKKDLLPGDVVWESGHVALFIGNNQLIEASYSRKIVRYSTLGNRFVYGYRAKEIER